MFSLPYFGENDKSAEICYVAACFGQDRSLQNSLDRARFYTKFSTEGRYS